ncbi:MAG: hypothetical protein IT438_04270 [Phycisphaerales bacterium]|nr:hypothetical protein [Phycisphaerales bacterium]
MGCHRKRTINYSLGVAVLCGTIGAAMAGCSKPLLSPTEERSPFDRYDNVRGNYAPQYIEDQYGRREPNLRGRLTPKE